MSSLRPVTARTSVSIASRKLRNPPARSEMPDRVTAGVTASAALRGAVVLRVDVRRAVAALDLRGRRAVVFFVVRAIVAPSRHSHVVAAAPLLRRQGPTLVTTPYA